ncbi:MAG: carbon-nitrogen hydrolase family protein [Acidobacteria bacterium]|uniref:Carbon-nitrogen hydrolase family protein n=1 Tax=Candidatus Polarisedimenticola svalbardensis TaxID=2886004 RepID=A0A8J6Y1Y9_9BACT|nr:carbon-nitrogen hydrolase family protein [Candidatus Polarisedimenticola svalbardensis]
MKIALVQQQAFAGREANRERGLEAVRTAAEAGAKLVCFAELAFDRFFPQEPADGDVTMLAEAIPGPATEPFQDLAREFGVVIVLNLFELACGKTYDASPVIDADGSILGVTRMVHIAEYACFHEQSYYTPGDRGAQVYDTAWGRVGVAICYDRHYPEYMRALGVAGAELVIVPQAGAAGEWPDGLYEAELQVAAFQNGYYTALCNRVGKESKLDFSGESFVCDPSGRVVAQAGRGTEEILYCDIDLTQVPGSHARRMFYRDRRPELYAGWIGK